MLNKKMFKSAVIISAVMLSVGGCAGGCSKQTEPVIADATVETPEPEENIETKEPTPSPTVEPTEEPVEESSSSEESSESEIDASEGEEVVQDESESTGIEIVEELDLTMYTQTACNARSGDSTDYDVVTTFSVNEQVHVTGKTVNEWFRVEQSDSEVYVSGKLLGMDKVVVQQQSNSSSGESSLSDSGQTSGGGDGSNIGSQPGQSLGTTTNGNEVIVLPEVDWSQW